MFLIIKYCLKINVVETPQQLKSACKKLT